MRVQRTWADARSGAGSDYCVDAAAAITDDPRQQNAMAGRGRTAVIKCQLQLRTKPEVARLAALQAAHKLSRRDFRATAACPEGRHWHLLSFDADAAVDVHAIGR